MVVKFFCSLFGTANVLAFVCPNLYNMGMSKNSVTLDRLLKKGGPIALAIRAGVKTKSMLHAHRHGAVPTLQWSIFYQVVAGFAEDGKTPLLPGDGWLSSVDAKRTRKRIERAIAAIAGAA